MDVENLHNAIIDTIKQFLNALDITGTVKIETLTEKMARVDITVSDGKQGYIIGKQGVTLAALQYVIALIARNNNSEIQYRVDINNYQGERDQIFLKRVIEYVQEKAESKELLLWPMTGYERRLVHEYYLVADTYKTESENFGDKRVIRLIKR